MEETVMPNSEFEEDIFDVVREILQDSALIPAEELRSRIDALNINLVRRHGDPSSALRALLRAMLHIDATVTEVERELIRRGVLKRGAPLFGGRLGHLLNAVARL